MGEEVRAEPLGPGRAGPPRSWPTGAAGHARRSGCDAAVSAARPGTAAGASSRMTWALVPERPKAETPARRGLPSSWRAQGARGIDDVDGERRPSRCGGLRGVGVQGRGQERRGAGRRRSWRRPARPAAASRWPMLVLSAPSRAASRGAAFAVDGGQGLDLDGVAEGGAGAVALDDVDVGGGEPGVVRARRGGPSAGRGRWGR